MKRHLTILIACPALAACGATASASAPTSQPAAASCGPATAQTLAATHSARIYLSKQVVYGCASRSGRAYRLGGTRGHFCRPACAGPIALAGRFAAYGVVASGTDFATSTVEVRDLVDGKLLVDLPAIAHIPGPESFPGVLAIVVKPDGAVAWLASVSGIGHPTATYEVQRADRHGQMLLDAGRQIAANSLRLHGSTLSWTHDGKVRSATLG